MSITLHKQQGSFFAEISATIAALSILTLIGTNFVDSQAGRAQVNEAFVLMQPIIENVNHHYTQFGTIGADPSNNNAISVYEKTEGGETYAGRYVKEVKSYRTGVVHATMNPQFSDASGDLVGKISNVQTAIQGKSIFFVPFRLGSSIPDDRSDRTHLKWACLTTINANPPTGGVIAPLDADAGVIHDQYFYAPGCVVISEAQATHLVNDYVSSPVNWRKSIWFMLNK